MEQGLAPRRLPYDTLDEGLQLLEKEVAFLELLATKDDTSLKIKACSLKIEAIIDACNTTLSASEQDFFSRLSATRHVDISTTIDKLKELRSFLERMAEAFLQENMAFIVSSANFILQHARCWLGVGCLADCFSSPEKFMESITDMHMLVLHSFPCLIGIPYDNLWVKESYARAARDCTRFPIAIRQEDSMCVICHEPVDHEESILTFERNCRPTEGGCCQGPSCKCKQIMHKDCLSNMILSDQMHFTFKTCPTCRAEFCVRDLELHVVSIIPRRRRLLEEKEGNKRARVITIPDDEEEEHTPMIRASVVRRK